MSLDEEDPNELAVYEAAAEEIIKSHPQWLSTAPTRNDLDTACGATAYKKLDAAFLRREVRKTVRIATKFATRLAAQKAEHAALNAEAAALDAEMAARLLHANAKTYEWFAHVLRMNEDSTGGAFLHHTKQLFTPLALVQRPGRNFTAVPQWMPTKTALSSQTTQSTAAPSLGKLFEVRVKKLLDGVYCARRRKDVGRFHVTTGGLEGSPGTPDLTRFVTDKYPWISHAVSYVEVKYSTSSKSHDSALHHATQQVVSRVMSQISYLDLQVMKSASMNCGAFTQDGFFQILVSLRFPTVTTLADTLQCLPSFLTVSCSKPVPFPTDADDLKAARRMVEAIDGWLYATESLKVGCTTVDGHWSDAGYTLQAVIRRSFRKPHVFVVSKNGQDYLWKEYRTGDVHPNSTKPETEEAALTALVGKRNVPQLIDKIQGENWTAIITAPVGAPVLCLQPGEFLDAGRQLLHALEEARASGVIKSHGDPSVSNIIRVDNNDGTFTYHLIDWGEAETVADNESRSSDGNAALRATTWLYAHPSMMTSDPNFKTDAFALVVSLIALLVGRWKNEEVRRDHILQAMVGYEAAHPQIHTVMRMAATADDAAAVLPNLKQWKQAFA